MTSWRCALPLPLSVNALFRNVPGHGRAKTREYREWISEAGWLLQSQKPKHFKGKIAIDLQLPRQILGDIDNRAKAVLDLLVGHSIITDDRHVDDLRIRRADLECARTCVVEVTAL